MKYFIIAAFVLSLVSCKKTETLKPEVLPDTYVDPDYIGKLESSLRIGVDNNGSLDSTFSFSSGLWEKSADPLPYVGFNKVIYNGRNILTIDHGVNFLDFANRSTWDIQSTHIGNFTHTDNTTVPMISNPVGVVPSTFSGGAFIINLHNLSGADAVVVSSFYDEINLSGSSQKLDVFGPNFVFNFTEGVADMPLNTDIRITVSLWKFNKLIRGKTEIEVNKVTNYVYKITKTN